MEIAYSCIVDNQPVFLAQSYLWVNVLLHFARIAPQNIYVHTVEVRNRRFLRWARRTGVHLVPVQRFDPRQAYCNKLSQLGTFVDQPCDYVILMDCDTVLLEPYSTPFQAPVYAKPVDFANPPLEMLEPIFQRFLGKSARASAASFKKPDGSDLTDRNNCNGGVYIIARKFLPELAASWRRWAKCCIDHIDLFAHLYMHVDQASFAMAMRDLGVDVEFLDLAWNYPIHLDPKLLPNLAPKMIHYHRQITPAGLIRAPGIPHVDGTVLGVNRFIQTLLAGDRAGRQWVRAMVRALHPSPKNLWQCLGEKLFGSAGPKT
jgi:hypothetical protein